MALVDVATGGIMRAARRAGYRDFYVQLRGRVSGHDVAAVLDTVDRGRQPSVVSTEGPWVLANGAVMVLVRSADSPAALDSWLQNFADSLSAQGISGRLAAAPRPSMPAWVGDIYAEQILTAFIAYDIVDPDPTHPYGWNTSASTAASVAQLVETGLFPDARTLLSTDEYSVTAPPIVDAPLARALGRGKIASLTHVRSDPPRLVQAALHTNGMALYQVHDRAQSWQERLEQCIDRLTALPAQTTVGFIQLAPSLQASWMGLGAGVPGLPQHVPEHFIRENAFLLTSRIPDARGVMVLTDDHLARTSDLSSWTVEPLGSGRHLVRAKNLAKWFAPGAVSGISRVVDIARRDLGALLMAPSDTGR